MFPEEDPGNDRIIGIQIYFIFLEDWAPSFQSFSNYSSDWQRRTLTLTAEIWDCYFFAPYLANLPSSIKCPHLKYFLLTTAWCQTSWCTSPPARRWSIPSWSLSRPSSCGGGWLSGGEWRGGGECPTSESSDEISIIFRGEFLKQNCPVSTCALTSDRNKKESADLILFKVSVLSTHLPSAIGLQRYLPLLCCPTSL